MTSEPVVLINVLKTAPENRDALLAMLRGNIEGVIRTLPGWRMSRLVAAADGAGVVIHSEWDSREAVAAMREDPRMKAYFPRIAAIASFDSTVGDVVFAAHSDGHEE